MIILSIINHNHDELIIKNPTLRALAKKYIIIIKSNTPASIKLKEYSLNNNIILLDEAYDLGFGQNNNYVFDYLMNEGKIEDNDYFLVINPDVIIEEKELRKLYCEVQKSESDIFTINLFHDENFTLPEMSIKKFPRLYSPLKGLLCKGNRSDAYNKSLINIPFNIDWAAGSFLLFRKKAFQQLGGFDTRYFMYFEDVDICYRARKMTMGLTYYPDIKAIHKGAFNNRNILSKHFRWYLMSYLTYHFLK